MFDSTPANRSRSGDQAASQAANGQAPNSQTGYSAQSAAPSRPVTRRRPTNVGAAPERNDRTFDILALWDDEVSALKDHVDVVSSWGPYELFECIPLFEGADGRRRVLCRFTYHGATSNRLTPDSTAQFKYALLNCLRQITQWEDVAGQNHVNANGA